ncbi:MAG: alpha/beta hydrolase [Pseudomonadota bacterium]
MKKICILYKILRVALFTLLASACGSSDPSGSTAPQNNQHTNGNDHQTSEKGVEIDPKQAVLPELRPFVDQEPTITFNSVTLRLARAKLAIDRPDVPESVAVKEIPGPGDAPNIKLYIADPDPARKNKPAFLHIHGGGYIVYRAQDMAPHAPGLAEECDCLVVSVDYRLAPETKFPGPMEDNFTALKWLYENADTIGVDRTRIAIGGESAGGGHAAQLAIAARDRGIPIVLQVLTYPMLDDRTGSTHAVPNHIGRYIWNAGSNKFAWTSYLGQPAGSDNPPYGAVPARVKDLSGLAPAWIGVGGSDLFLAEDLEYARRLTEAGVHAELLLVPGAFHAFDGIASETSVAKRFHKSRVEALRRALHL